MDDLIRILIIVTLQREKERERETQVMKREDTYFKKRFRYGSGGFAEIWDWNEKLSISENRERQKE